MWFGVQSCDDAVGGLLAHAIHQDDIHLNKGRRLTAADAAALRAAGVLRVTVARLAAGDVDENTAAARLAAAVTGDGVVAGAAATGRVNLFATAAGLLRVDVAAVNAANRVSEELTLATLAPDTAVAAGQMVATAKVIPFAVADELLQQAAAAVSQAGVSQAGGAALRLAAYRPLRARLIQTVAPGVKPAMLDKTARATADRLADLGGGVLLGETRCAHQPGELAAALNAALNAAPSADLLLIAGASAVSDRRDVVPAAVALAGGEVLHLGMPVDPGNLLLLGRIGGRPLVGMPGCARSPRLNGFDWVLRRLAAGVATDAADIMAMGVGGLLADIPGRPAPRAPADVIAPLAQSIPVAPPVAAVVLAAGRSRRMGEENKLLSDIAGAPLIVHTVDHVLQSAARPVIVVTGHQAAAVSAALADRPVTLVYNPDFADGIASSLRVGLAAVPADAAGALICLGDMPEVTGRLIDRLIGAFDPSAGRGICVPTHDGRRGNPVLWSRDYFVEMAESAGDSGARHLIGRYAAQVCAVAMDAAGVLNDIDAPQDLANLRNRHHDGGK